jgi:hypothetical protein
MMTDIAWISPEGKVFKMIPDTSIYHIMWNAEKVLSMHKHLYPDADYDYADEYLLAQGWVHIVRLNDGVVATYKVEKLSDATFDAVDKFLWLNYEPEELNSTFKTDWAYESAFH